MVVFTFETHIAYAMQRNDRTKKYYATDQDLKEISQIFFESTISDTCTPQEKKALLETAKKIRISPNEMGLKDKLILALVTRFNYCTLNAEIFGDENNVKRVVDGYVDLMLSRNLGLIQPMAQLIIQQLPNIESLVELIRSGDSTSEEAIKNHIRGILTNMNITLAWDVFDFDELTRLVIVNMEEQLISNAITTTTTITTVETSHSNNEVQNSSISNIANMIISILQQEESTYAWCQAAAQIQDPSEDLISDYQIQLIQALQQRNIILGVQNNNEILTWSDNELLTLTHTVMELMPKPHREDSEKNTTSSSSQKTYYEQLKEGYKKSKKAVAKTAKKGKAITYGITSYLNPYNYYPSK